MRGEFTKRRGIIFPAAFNRWDFARDLGEYERGLIDSISKNDEGEEEALLKRKCRRVLFVARWRYRLTTIGYAYAGFRRFIWLPAVSRIKAALKAVWSRVEGLAKREKAALAPRNSGVDSGSKSDYKLADTETGSEDSLP
jgi:hypothetical protein